MEVSYGGKSWQWDKANHMALTVDILAFFEIVGINLLHQPLLNKHSVLSLRILFDIDGSKFQNLKEYAHIPHLFRNLASSRHIYHVLQPHNKVAQKKVPRPDQLATKKHLQSRQVLPRYCLANHFAEK